VLLVLSSVVATNQAATDESVAVQSSKSHLALGSALLLPRKDNNDALAAAAHSTYSYNDS
jgi:hypothetical protein